MGVGEIDPEDIEGSEPDHEGSIPTPKQNELIIFVVLITWHKQTNQHQENGTTALPAGCSPCKNIGLHPGPGRASPILNELENQ